MMNVKLLPVIFCLVLSSTGVSQENKIIIIKDVTAFAEIIKDKNIQLVDVRTVSEYEKEKISNIINSNFYNEHSFTLNINKLDKETPVYLYCHSRVRSKKASKNLQRLGFKKTFDFSPGYKA